jgi:putative tryptophan/tyrosine transport system substrate-binding protein
MKRRDVIVGLLVAAATGRAQAQQTGKVYRVAFVDRSTPVAQLTEDGGLPAYRRFFEELRRLGYVEGQNLVVERYSGEGRAEHYPELAHEVVRRKPDVIFVIGPSLVLDFKSATATIPIVGMTGDPVAYGIVAALARPGGNITGVSVDPGFEIWGKRLELLREAIPSVSRVTYLAPRPYWDGPPGAEMRKAVKRAGIVLVGPPLDAPIQEAEYRRVFTAMAQEGADALVVSEAIENYTSRLLIVELADKARLPAIYPYREYVEISGLMAYAIDTPDLGRRAADQIDQILKGTKPGEIPYYQPTTFKLSINLKTAKTLGLTIPPSLMTVADEVIE